MGAGASAASISRRYEGSSTDSDSCGERDRLSDSPREDGVGLCFEVVNQGSASYSVEAMACIHRELLLRMSRRVDVSGSADEPSDDFDSILSP